MEKKEIEANAKKYLDDIVSILNDDILSNREVLNKIYELQRKQSGRTRVTIEGVAIYFILEQYRYSMRFISRDYFISLLSTILAARGYTITRIYEEIAVDGN